MKDPAFLFYDGDAARDVSHMNRLERGCYFDLIQAQRKFHGFAVEQARKILGSDFETCWPALELILHLENDKYSIEWLANSLEKRTKYSETQRKRSQDYWDKKKIPGLFRGISTDIPLENEIENKDLFFNKDIFLIKNKIKEIQKKLLDPDLTTEDYNELVDQKNMLEKEKEKISGEKEKEIPNQLTAVELEQELKHSQTWIEKILRDPRISFDQAEIYKYLSIFVNELDVKEDLNKSLSEIKRHFYNWIIIKSEKKTTHEKSKKHKADPTIAVDEGGYGYPNAINLEKSDED